MPGIRVIMKAFSLEVLSRQHQVCLNSELTSHKPVCSVKSLCCVNKQAKTIITFFTSYGTILLCVQLLLNVQGRGVII